MQILLGLSLIISVLLGIYVLIAGDWTKMHLKRAGVLLATTGAIWLAFACFFVPESSVCHASDIMCASFKVYCLVKNVAIIIFQYAYGRDAVKYKNQERRGVDTWKTATSSSRPARLRA
jgi:hypothetical protein